ncbi:hypothetical protein Ptr902_05526 [Pyrenophora tritici-repentis]|nr:hypothetical protein Ptr902_05526 [Pyrenophora tritici-repentis]
MAPPSACHTLTANSHQLKNTHDGDYPKTTYPKVPKRRRSRGGLVEMRKKYRKGNLVAQSPRCPLLEVFQEYGLLENILSNLSSDDLLALLLSSKSIHGAIVPQSGSLENLLGRLSCSGKGVKIRKKYHKKSCFFDAYNCTEHVTCGATQNGVESKPCVKCKVTTCDECRIHCVYQSIFEKPCEDDELPNFSGFVMLSSSEVPILSPHHLAVDQSEPYWQKPTAGLVAPHHDQGFIDIPCDEDSYGPPECVERLLDVDLGQHNLAGPGSSSVAAPSPVLKSLHKVTERRKRWFCDTCIPSDIEKRREGCQMYTCQCSLRSRFLDRWLCLRCYEAEEATLSTAFPNHTKHCSCGQQSGRETCLWCWGEILRPDIDHNTHAVLHTN